MMQMHSKPPVRRSDAKQQIHTPMNRIIILIGVALVLILLIAAVPSWYSFYMGSTLNPSSKTYVDESLLAITRNWSQKELIDRASPQMCESTTTGELNFIFAKCTLLGPVVHYGGATGNVNINISLTNGQVITAHYVAKATFVHGSAEFDISLIRIDGEWKILELHVNSSIFAQ